jgi:hypothetical protein
MKLRKLTTEILLGAVFFLLCSVSVHAGFGISPTDVNNQFLKPGASFEKEFTISRSESLEEMDVIIEPDLGEIDSWITYQPAQTFKLQQGETTKTFMVVVNVPTNAEYKEYKGVIRIKAVPSASEISGISITQGIRLDADLLVTKDDVKLLSVTSIKASDSDSGQPIKIYITGENQGNVDISPTLKIRMLNLTMDVVEEKELSNFGTIKPNQTSTLTAEFASKLPEGQYYLEATVLADGEEIRTEKLAVKITNPTAINSTDDNDKNITVISRIGNFIKENKTFVIYISAAALVALTVEGVVYTFVSKTYKTKLKKGLAVKGLGSIFARSRLTRATLSFAFGFLVFLGFIFYPMIESKPLIQNTDTSVKGAASVSINNSLQVVPEPTAKSYSIYERPNTSSAILYTAKENEQFNVINETDGWYEVRLQDQTNGWLEKSIVKSTTTEDN